MNEDRLKSKINNCAVNLLITSPAGSGKTQKLSDRYISILINQFEEKGKIFPERIVAITFTEKAASEMKERILSEIRTNKFIYQELISKIDKMRISTIHSFFLSLYRRFALEAKLNPQVEILDENQQKELIERIYNQFAFNKLTETNEIASDLTFLLALYGWNKIRELIKEYVRFRRKILILSKENLPSYQINFSNFLSEYEKLIKNLSYSYKEIKFKYEGLLNVKSLSVALKFFQVYERIKNEQGKLDFDDIEIKLLNLLENKELCLNLLYDFDLHFDYLLIDEFQDTNFIQWQIIKSLTEEWFSGIGAKQAEGIEPSIFLVGDPKQSIYLFRGANVEVIHLAKYMLEKNKKLNKEDRFEIIQENRNFRSNSRIIDFVNKVFSKIMQSDKEGKQLWKVNYEEFVCSKEKAQPGEVSIHIYFSKENIRSNELAYFEAQIVSNKITELINEGIPLKDIAILMKARTHLEAFENTLLKANIPFKVYKGKGFFKEKEIQLLLALTKFLFNPKDEISLLSVLKSPFYNFTQDQLVELSKEKELSKFKALKKLYPPIYKELKKYIHYFKSEHSYLVINDFLIRKEGYKIFSEKQRYANILKFLNMLEEMEYNSEDKLEIKKRLEHMEEKGDLEKANITDEEFNALSILTIHAAKGLEFPYVFIVQAASELEKSYEKLVSFETIDSIDPLIIKSDFAVSPSKEKNPILSEYQQRKYEEFKRLFYVACTRAKEKLFITASFNKKPQKNSWLDMLSRYNFLKINNNSIELSEELKNTVSLHIYSEPPTITISEKKPISIKKFYDIPTKSSQVIEEKFPSEPPIFYIHSKKEKLNLKIIGEVLHKILNRYTKGEIKDSEFEQEALSLLNIYSNDDFLKNILLDYINIIKNKGILHIAAPAKNKYSEFPFFYKKDKELWKGKIDLLIVEEDAILIYDYKTSLKEKSKFIKYYKHQLELYSEAISTIWQDKKIKKSIIKLLDGEIIEL